MSETTTPNYTREPQPPPRVDNPLRPKTPPKSRRVVSGSSSRPPVAPRTPPKRSETDYRPGLNGLVQIAAAVPIMVGRGHPTALADSAAIGIYGPQITEGMNEIAKTDPRMAAICEAVTKIGPYGAVLTPLFALVTQLATNHKPELYRITGKMGAAMPGDLVNKFLADQEEISKALEREAAAANANGNASQGSHVPA